MASRRCQHRRRLRLAVLTQLAVFPHYGGVPNWPSAASLPSCRWSAAALRGHSRPGGCGRVAMRGRKPKPTPEALRQPGQRPIRGDEPSRRSQPTCPAHLSPTAKAEWKRLAQSLNEIGLLTQVDRAALRRLLPVLRPLGRGRAEARRNAGDTEDARRLRPALAVARDLEQAARADGEVHGGDRAYAVVAEQARDQDSDPAEAVGVRGQQPCRFRG